MSATTDTPTTDVSSETAQHELALIGHTVRQSDVFPTAFGGITIDDDGFVTVTIEYPGDDVADLFDAESGTYVTDVYYEINAVDTVDTDPGLYTVSRVIVERGVLDDNGFAPLDPTIERRELVGSCAHEFPQAFDYAVNQYRSDTLR